MLKQVVAGFDPKELQELFEPIKNHKSIGLAVSGGADSLALMVLVRRWLGTRSAGPKIVVYTMDHGLRAEAANECENVEKIACQYGFEVRTLVWRGIKPTNGIQAAARHARYDLINQAMRESGVEVLLTGHHRDDQAETVLMRLAHSSGLNGLRCMDKITDIMGANVFRPFLTIPQVRLVNVVEEAGLEISVDPSNKDEKYERVRWRNMMGPLAEMGLTSSVLTKFSARMGRANAALEEIAQNAYDSHVKNDQFGVGSIPHKIIVGLGEETGIRVLSRMIFAASGGRSKGELGQHEMIVEMIAKQPFRGVSVGGCMVQKYQGTIVVFRESFRVDDGIIQLLPAEKIVWDQRFNIRNETETLFEIKLADTFTRGAIEKLMAQNITTPMAGLHAAPMIVDQRSATLAIGAHSFAQGVICKLVEYKNDQFNFVSG